MKTLLILLVAVSLALPNIQGFCPIVDPVKTVTPPIYTFTGSIALRYLFLDGAPFATRHKRFYSVLIPLAVSTFAHVYRGNYFAAGYGAIGSVGSSLVIYRF